MRPINLKQLGAALKWKTRKDRSATQFRFEDGGFSLNYEGKDGIFDQARQKLLPSFYRTEFPDNEEGHLQMADAVMASVDAKQVTLEEYFKESIPKQEIEQAAMADQTSSKTESVQQTTGAGTESAGTMAGGAHLPSTPSLSQTSTPRVSRILQSSPQDEGPATAKMRRFEEANPATAKIESLQSAAANPGLRFKQGVGSNFRTFSSRARISFREYSGRIAGGLGQIAKGVGRGIVGPGLSGGANFLGKVGVGGINFSANLSNQIAGRGALVKGSSKKIALAFLGMFLLFAIGAGLIGGLTGGGTTPGGTTPAVSTGADISSCKFTRAGNSQLVKSSLLQGLISNAAVSAGIPAPVLASVAMHESQDFVANADDNHDAIKSRQYCNYGKVICINKENTGTLYDSACLADDTAAGAKTAQAVGLMQNIDIYNQGAGDLCNITNSLTIAAAKLKKDGVTLQPTQEQIKIGVKAYYNDCDYNGGDYCKEVWQDLQNCQTQTPSTPVAPLVNNEYIGWIKNNFNVSLDPSFGEEKIRWAYDILNVSIQVAPNFKKLISSKGSIEVVPGGAISSRSPGKINLSSSSTDTQDFFKVTLIHELGHAIKGDRSENTYQISIAVADDKDFLTGYAQGSTARNEVCAGVDSKEQLVQVDEDFAESITYYINKDINELDFDKLHSCPPKTTVNPYLVPSANNTKIPKYLNHCQLMRSLLGGQNCPLSF